MPWQPLEPFRNRPSRNSSTPPGREIKRNHLTRKSSESLKKAYPKLRDPAGGEFTQPRTSIENYLKKYMMETCRGKFQLYCANLSKVPSVKGKSARAHLVDGDLVVPQFDGPRATERTGGQVLSHPPLPVHLIHPVLQCSEPGQVLGEVLCPGVQLQCSIQGVSSALDLDLDVSCPASSAKFPSAQAEHLKY